MTRPGVSDRWIKAGSMSENCQARRRTFLVAKINGLAATTNAHRANARRPR